MFYKMTQWRSFFAISVSLFSLMFFSQIDAKAMRASGALQAELGKARQVPQPAANAPAPDRSPVAAVSGPVRSDEYVQTEAHLQLDAVKEKMSKFIMRVPEDPNKPERPLTPNQIVTPLLNIVAAVIDKEVELKNSHYVFYNASNNEWRVPQDLYKKLYIHYKKIPSQLNDFAFVRFGQGKTIKAQDFLNENIAQWGGINDNIGEVRDVVMSVNLALFGNVGFPGECTWNYFIEAKSHRWPFPQNYFEILKAFDVTYDIELLAKEAQSLSEMLIKASPEQTLFQFCIPQNKVDDVAYVSWILGFPAHPKSMELVEGLLEGKPRVGTFTGPAVKSVMRRFKNEKDNPVYKELVELAAAGEFGISGFMESMRNDPFKIPNLNETQGRILVTNEIFKNPALGAKIFTYFTTPDNIQADYMSKLNSLVQKIISAEASKTPQQKAADRAKNEATFERLEQERKAQEAAAKAAEKAAKAQGKK